mgnify:CR=1 FL=1
MALALSILTPSKCDNWSHPTRFVLDYLMILLPVLGSIFCSKYTFIVCPAKYLVCISNKIVHFSTVFIDYRYIGLWTRESTFQIFSIFDCK